MGLLVLLLDNKHPAAEVGPSVVQGLAELGVTGVAVLRDEQTTAVSLEGWAFDAERSAQAAARAVASDPGAVRILRPVIESSVSRRFESAIRTESQRNEAREAS